jgi:hypothetical protein
MERNGNEGGVLERERSKENKRFLNQKFAKLTFVFMHLCFYI